VALALAIAFALPLRGDHLGDEQNPARIPRLHHPTPRRVSWLLGLSFVPRCRIKPRARCVRADRLKEIG
jgi:hypothetical protein